jgi:hypothetical protein
MLKTGGGGRTQKGKSRPKTKEGECSRLRCHQQTYGQLCRTSVPLSGVLGTQLAPAPVCVKHNALKKSDMIAVILRRGTRGEGGGGLHAPPERRGGGADDNTTRAYSGA